MLNTPQDQAKNLISKSQKILILPSSPPDGDSLGSAIALYLVLKKMGKEATVVCADPVPEVYHFLPSEKVITDTFNANRDFYIAVDLSNAEIGNVTHTVENGKINIVITPKKGDISEK
ncbi:hypothetical protein HZA41_01320, partial [Candidatus Peregrinibacteria bacterium]|nr:hypothetical protein [Candidatus Peregrinibacteria bacterium]